MPENGIIKQICGLLAHVGSSESKNVMVRGKGTLEEKSDRRCVSKIGIRTGLQSSEGMMLPSRDIFGCQNLGRLKSCFWLLGLDFRDAAHHCKVHRN